MTDKAEPVVPADAELIARVENILRSPKTISYPSSASAEYVREQMQALLMAYLALRKQVSNEQQS